MAPSVVADYGNFVLLQANDALANSLAGNANAQVVDYNNLVLLNAKTIDTTTPDAQSIRGTEAAKSGNQMRLIQFKGPIRPEWYKALAKTDVRIVTYIPNNAYLVYGSAERLARSAAVGRQQSCGAMAGRVHCRLTALILRSQAPMVRQSSITTR